MFLEEVRNSLIDSEERDRMMDDLTGLIETGFTSETLLADIQSLQNREPYELRAWRIGEAFAEVFLEKKFVCRFHWNELRDARNPRGNKTGADLVGFIDIDGTILFLFGEVKTSSETKNRPPQVMTNADGIEKQLSDLYNSKEKRKILIEYLASKTRNLSNNEQFKVDYQSALESYYSNNCYNCQLIGVLVRDVNPDETDVSISYNKLKNIILDPCGLKLIAVYVPIEKSKWEDMISGKIK